MAGPDKFNELSPLQQLISGRYGLALTYWTLFLAAAAIFFVAGSMAVSAGAWSAYVLMVAASIGWSFVLLLGIQAGYKGEDPGKAIARIAMLFLLLNLSNILATLSFI